jgi:hypothetical protein
MDRYLRDKRLKMMKKININIKENISAHFLFRVFLKFKKKKKM